MRCITSALRFHDRNAARDVLIGHVQPELSAQHIGEFALGREPPLVGVPVRIAYARQCLKAERPVVFDWMGDFPIVTGAVPPEVWREDLPL